MIFNIFICFSNNNETPTILPPAPAGLSAKEAALLKELSKRVGDLEEALR